MLAPAADGTPAEQDFLPGAIHECGVATIVWTTIVAYDKTKFPGEKPSKLADFFDVKKFPGMRGISKRPVVAMEFALMADGVPPERADAVLSELLSSPFDPSRVPPGAQDALGRALDRLAFETSADLARAREALLDAWTEHFDEEWLVGIRGDMDLLALLPPGAFIALGLLVAAKNLIDQRQAAARRTAPAATTPAGQPG